MNVAPLTGSVDRNLLGGRDDDRRGPVAPLTGSVDRNNYANYAQALARMSLPSRGAWIEIAPERPAPARLPVAPLTGSVDRNLRMKGYAMNVHEVAPLTGSVDRNLQALELPLPLPKSLPSRGAWIEITGSTSANSW